MLKDVINILKDISLRHKGVCTFKYQSDILNNAQNNHKYYQVYVDDISLHQLNITTNIFKAEFQVYVLGFVDDDNDVICWLDIRQVDKTKVTEESKNVLYLIIGNEENTYEELENTFDYKGRFLIDTKYEVQTMHQVRYDLEINEAVQEFKNTIMRRFNRLDNDLKNANTILLVNNQNDLTDEDIKTNINELLEIYPNKEIIFLNVINGTEYKKRKVQLNSNILLLQYTIIDEYVDVPDVNEWDHWVGNIREWEKILADFQLK